MCEMCGKTLESFSGLLKCTDESGPCYVCWKANTAFHLKSLTCGGSSAFGLHASRAALNERILQNHIRYWVRWLQLKQHWVMMHRGNPKQAKIIHHNGWKSQFGTTVQTPKQPNVTELKWIYIKDWAKIPPQRCVRLKHGRVLVLSCTYFMLNEV